MTTSTDYRALAREISTNLKPLRQGLPDVMQSFYALGKAATVAGVLDTKTKELIALALGVAARCDGCLAFHSQALVELGATREEIAETLGMAVYMGGGPSVMYASNAIAAFEQFSSAQEEKNA